MSSHATAARIEPLLYSACEACRLASQVLREIRKAGYDDCHETARHCARDRAGLELVAFTLQERFGCALPSATAQMLDKVRLHQNRCRRNLPRIEAVMLALHLAEDALDRTLDVLFDDEDADDEDRDVIFGCFDVVQSKLGVFECVTVYVDPNERKKMLAAIEAGRPLPVLPEYAQVAPDDEPMPEWIEEMAV